MWCDRASAASFHAVHATSIPALDNSADYAPESRPLPLSGREHMQLYMLRDLRHECRRRRPFALLIVSRCCGRDTMLTTLVLSRAAE
jgi:hypothetical protein